MNLIIAAFYRDGLLALERAHNRTQPGTGLNVLNKLMKSTHRTQGGHDKNLYSCETRAKLGECSLYPFVYLSV